MTASLCALTYTHVHMPHTQNKFKTKRDRRKQKIEILKTELLYELVIPLLSMYPKKMKTLHLKKLLAVSFIAILLIITKST